MEGVIARRPTYCPKTSCQSRCAMGKAMWKHEGRWHDRAYTLSRTAVEDDAKLPSFFFRHSLYAVRAHNREIIKPEIKAANGLATRDDVMYRQLHPATSNYSLSLSRRDPINVNARPNCKQNGERTRKLRRPMIPKHTRVERVSLKLFRPLINVSASSRAAVRGWRGGCYQTGNERLNSGGVLSNLKNTPIFRQSSGQLPMIFENLQRK